MNKLFQVSAVLILCLGVHFASNTVACQESETTHSKGNKQGDNQGEPCTLHGTLEARGIPTDGIEMVLFYQKRGEDGQTEKMVEVARTKPGPKGAFAFTAPKEKIQPDQNSASYSIYCYNQEGDWIGGANTFASFQDTKKVKPLHSPVLMEFETRQFKLVDHNSKPLANTKVETNGFGHARFEEFKAAQLKRRPLRDLVQLKIGHEEVTHTNDAGEFSIRFPKNGSARIVVKDKLGGMFIVRLGPKASNVSLDSSASINGTITCDDPEFDKTSCELNFNVPTDFNPAENYYRHYNVVMRPDKEGKINLPNVAPGIYRVYLQFGDNRFYAPLPSPIKTTPGQKATLPIIAFKKGNPVTGRVIDKKTGKGVPDVYVSASQRPVGTNGISWSSSTRTDETGRYTAYCPPGKVTIRFVKSGTSKYKSISYRELAPYSAIEVLEGEIDKNLPDFFLSEGMKIKGIVVNENGEAVPDMDVAVLDSSAGFGFPAKSNSKGEIQFEKIDQESLYSVRASSNKLGMTTNGAITLDPKLYLDKPLKIVVSKAFPAYAKGLVVDSNNKPITNFKIDGEGVEMYVTREGQRYGRGSSISGFAESTNDGTFKTYAMQPGDTYSLTVRASGYKEQTLKSFIAKKGETIDFGKISLKRTNLVLAGRVIDSNGQPISDAKLFGSADSQLPISGRSDKSGQFEIIGWPEAPAILFVEKDGYRFHAKLIEKATNKAEIRIRKLDQPSPLKIVEKPYSDEARMKLCRDLLMRLYKLPADKRAQITGVIFLYLSKVAPEEAMELAAKPENEKYRGLVAATVAEAIIKTNPDEALALLRENKNRRAGIYVLNAANRDDLKMETRRKLAGIFQDHVSLTADSDKIYKIAQLANLLKRLGEEEAAEKLAEESFKLAEELTSNGREAFIMGFAAEQLSVFDLVRAQNLVASMKAGRGTSKNRHLGGIAAEIAAENPEQAIQIVEGIDARYTPRVVHAIAKNDFAKAIKVASGLLDRGDTTQYCNAVLAALLGAKDKLDPRESRVQIDKLFKIYRSHDNDFDSLANFGFESGYAAFSTVVAQKLGLKDVSEYSLKTIASRRRRTRISSNVGVLNATLKMAKYLALVDRRTSRILLDQIEAQREIIGGGGSFSIDQKEYLIAWALTDAEKAKQVFERMLTEQLKKKDVISQIPMTTGFMVLGNKNYDALLREMTRRDTLWFPGRE